MPKEAEIAVTRDSSGAFPSGGSLATLSHALALLSLESGLLFPLAMLHYAGILLATVSMLYPLLVYNARDYFGAPVLLLTILLGHLSQLAVIRLPSPPMQRRLATIGFWIGYLSLIFIVGAFFIALAVSR